jgi:hypothetical protein
VGDKRQAVGKGNGRDHEVVGANYRALARQVSADASIFLGSTIVERE